jgi:uncharacterized peroxidase-related enzyme
MTEYQTIPGVRVPVVGEEQATGRTAELFEEIKKVTGLPFVPDMFRLTSTAPQLMQVTLAGYGGMFGDSELPRDIKELISAWTSKVNGCPYCVGTHNWFLRQFGGTEELTAAVESASSPDELPVDDRTKELMRLVTRVSTEPYKIVDADWDRVEAAGWTRTQILEAVFNAALFNFINRLVDSVGLGTTVRQSRISQQEVTADSAG